MRLYCLDILLQCFGVWGFDLRWRHSLAVYLTCSSRSIGNHKRLTSGYSSTQCRRRSRFRCIIRSDDGFFWHCTHNFSRLLHKSSYFSQYSNKFLRQSDKQKPCQIVAISNYRRPDGLEGVLFHNITVSSHSRYSSSLDWSLLIEVQVLLMVISIDPSSIR